MHQLPTTVRVNTDGDATLPTELCDHWGLARGDSVEIYATVVEPADAAGRQASFAATLTSNHRVHETTAVREQLGVPERPSLQTWVVAPTRSEHDGRPG